MNTKIFVVCHKDAYVPDSEILVPIQVGAELATKPIHTGPSDDKVLLDDVGEHISGRNKSFCELTAHYYAWKNIDADYYGFFHYRRYFSFDKNTHEEDGWGNIVIDSLTDDDIEKYHLDDKSIRELVEKYDVITVRGRDINKNRPEPYKFTNYSIYIADRLQHKEDIDGALEIIRQDYPEFVDAASRYMASDTAYDCNMFIMSREHFHRYCEWLFDILFKLEARMDTTNYSHEEYRAIGFIAERLWGVYYTYLKSDPTIRRCELQKILIRNTDLPVVISPLGRDHIPIVLASNDGFVPYLSTMLESIVENASPDRCYDIVVLHRDITVANQSILASQIQGYTNINLRFADVSSYFSRLCLYVSHHLSVETYYRLVASELMPDYDKILYLDADMVMMCDAAEIFDIDIGDSVIAGARDIDITGQARVSEAMEKYIKDDIGLGHAFDYFQAGVLIISLERLRRLASVEELLEIATSKSWMCHDQDVLNHVCKGRVHYLPQSYNVLMNWREGDRQRLDFIKHAPMWLYDEYIAARKSPRVVHFAGKYKPGDEAECDMNQYFWHYARKSPYYEAIIQKKNAVIHQDATKRGIIAGGLSCIKDHGLWYTICYIPKKIKRVMWG